MGKFYTALHIKSKGKDKFIKMFTQLMKKDGYVPCSEDEAVVSYAAVFSESGWVTLSNGDNSTNELSKTAKKIAEGMKTSCFTAEAVDSDFAILELHTPSGRASRVVVGDGEGYGVEKAPFSTDDWKPLLQNGDIEKFLAVIGQDSTFVEDTLYDIGKIIGIRPSVMTWCYDEFEEEIGQDGNVISLSFRKTAEKKLTLNAAFNKIFGEGLEPLGFKKIKSKHPYFVRIINAEIVQVVTLMRDAGGVDWGEFEIKYGIATVYRQRIDFNSPPQRLDWLSTLYSEKVKNYNNVQTFNSVFKYYEYVKKGIMAETIEQAISLTIKEIIPQFDAVNDLASCMSFFLRHNQPVDFLLHYERPDFSNNYPGFESNEGLLWVIVKDRNMYQKEKFPNLPMYDKIFSDELWLGKAVKELERRKFANFEILKTYGIVAQSHRKDGNNHDI